MLYFTKEKKDCTGCTACKAICPVTCIDMVKDELGFPYPVADLSLCIHCGLCEQVCPMRQDEPVQLEDRVPPMAYAAITNDDVIWRASASGGAFSEISRNFASGNEETVVYGAAFNELMVEHQGLPITWIQAFHRSKYVQSDMKECFREIKAHLKGDRTVVFSGTPCQNAGLRMYVGREYSNLLCVDLVCHGVGSPDVFAAYLREKGTAAGKGVYSYEFRTKKRSWGNYPRYRSEIRYTDGESEAQVEDPYTRLFLRQLCLRNCCGENCRFRSATRWSDLTIADFNHLSRVFPKVRDGRAYSTIIASTRKGADIVAALHQRMRVMPCELSDVVRYNPLFARQAPGNPNRDAFFEAFVLGTPVLRLAEQYAQKQRATITGWIVRHFPYGLKYLVNRLVVTLKRKRN